MANDSSNPGKVEVNGEAPALDPTRRNQITVALASNGGLKRIEGKLKQGLDEAGWSQAIREYADVLLRGGEVTTFPELEERIYDHIKANERGTTVPGSSGAPDLAVPRDALDHGATQVKKELAEILQPKKK